MIIELEYFRTMIHRCVPDLETLLVGVVASCFREPPGSYWLSPPFRRGLIECGGISVCS
uniref:Predicted protein n=1 Tax=Hordeum vulgare subsp. vulgare TaxID=112509 RepID=F2EJD3_HORVV|nr:predicted protein [Hordeum vulgare subsp. vulgare]